ncbi:ATP-binding cassette domain-containing protein [Chelatococcus daeguensis]|uniref:ABC transporter ATP-binding protein n=2 Tax=Chelatococcus TaxID=28209 RepID=A0AAC9JRP7_9HYPH|nr:MULTISPECIES: ATP-binding cassette domain-containing protein [Chelatococcus]APF38011.1 ABC transporter ATP-binding protein [Chelatococcus daeguensis]KZE28513.1 ABC transporter ATP-binding protein [Chelatococcus daeguensis]MBM3083472.1 ATP-binding cassette domain-containing protein [Chelatococcus daeguensis]CUA84050.1 amino acid ABC transporter ATP-binding protein, PAAT family (TC 3.A.1.3.-) [Chelatococcus sambhunathii]
MHARATILPLSLDRVTYARGGETLIDGISVTIGSSSRTVVLGPNGAGKSLLLRLCHGLVAPTDGAVRWAGADAFGRRDTAGRQAMVFQRPVLLRRSALANITYALALQGRLERGERDARAREALASVGLAHVAERPARVLSGGEQQRLAIARAAALEPDVLFLDEPTASLDPGASRAIEDAIRAIDAAGTKIIMTTHDLGQARRLAEEVLFLCRGRLMEHTPAGEFFEHPRTPQAAAFLRGDLVA